MAEENLFALEGKSFLPGAKSFPPNRPDLIYFLSGPNPILTQPNPNPTQTPIQPQPNPIL